MELQAMTERKQRKTCTYHCAACDAHFHSLAAFDAHDPGGRCDVGATNRKTGLPLLEAWTTAGHCDLSGQHPVTIYVMAGLDARREGLSGLSIEPKIGVKD
jgi:hypothetical protein